MNWTETVKQAAILAQAKGYITFHELDQIIPDDILPGTLQSMQLESLLMALSEEGIKVK